jgi:hypothetical protein
MTKPIRVHMKSEGLGQDTKCGINGKHSKDWRRVTCLLCRKKARGRK